MGIKYFQMNKDMKGQADDKVYRGLNNYTQFIEKRDTAQGNAASAAVRLVKQAGVKKQSKHYWHNLQVVSWLLVFSGAVKSLQISGSMFGIRTGQQTSIWFDRRNYIFKAS